MADFDPDKPRAHREVIIQDLRHRRDVDATDEEPAPEPEPAAATEEPVKVAVRELQQEEAAKAAEALDELPVAATGAEGATVSASTGDAGVSAGGAGQTPDGEPDSATQTADAMAGDQEFTDDEIRAMEREQLRQIISLGLVNYLKYQLTMVLNFALLSLGSAPDPVTGLVTKDLPQAKLAIDVLEFMVARLQGEMSVAERQQMAQLVSDLKYSFMQVAADGAPPAGGMPGGAAGEA